ncbi:hypothetical protein ACQP1G_16430 [Nocardia sp. CA-107356]|uniref:hypothetical protein n=1 Tax=Nocardia sp. CA-107356 TaxID=3239972 RepID=UPI003D8FC5CF
MLPGGQVNDQRRSRIAKEALSVSAKALKAVADRDIGETRPDAPQRRTRPSGRDGAGQRWK